MFKVRGNFLAGEYRGRGPLTTGPRYACWQIEVNHRDEKSLLGVGQAQVRSALSVPRQPALVVAAYSLLLLAALQAFGPTRTSDYLPLPQWRKPAARPSLLDILALLRQQINETSVSSLGGVLSPQTLIGCAYT